MYCVDIGDFGVTEHVKFGSLLFKQNHVKYIISERLISYADVHLSCP
jgi:hypothetical protein